MKQRLAVAASPPLARLTDAAQQVHCRAHGAVGAHLGGAASKGHGACSVRIASATRTRSLGGPVPVNVADAAALVAVEQTDPTAADVAERYAQHVAANADAIRAEILS